MSYPQTTFSNVRFEPGGFWHKKRKNISTEALKYQLEVLKNSGRYAAFRLGWHEIYDDAPEIWPVPKHQFWDSDVAKWIEGACYLLMEQDDAVIRAHVEELTDMIAAAQQPDGYLNIHFTVVEPTKRFTNLRDLHELYNAGHLIEGALAHEKAFGNQKLLGPISKYVDLLHSVFGPAPGQKPGYPGHPEIELALLRLYERSLNPKHLELARFFLTERGNPRGVEGQHYYDWEEKLRGETRVPDYFPEPRSYWYQQAHLPIIEQQTIEGHSVRAMYLLTALADILRIESANHDERLGKEYGVALHRLWNNMVQRKMYMTGGIGSTKQWEGFSYDFFLPQGTEEGGCYAETCASIGVMMLADRLLQIDSKGSYGDVMELALYNAVLTGVSCSGKEWTYVNQLASSDQDLSRRSDWFTVACCPPNVLRLLGDLGGYVYNAHTDDSARKLRIELVLFANVLITERVAGDEVKLRMKTRWPLDGIVDLEVSSPNNVQLEIAVRVPAWCSNDWAVMPSAECQVSDGFLYLDAAYVAAHPSFRLDFKMLPRLVRPSVLTGQSIVAVARGPLIYCVEDVDNGWVKDHFRSTALQKSCGLEEEMVTDQKTGEEYVRIRARHGLVNLDVGEGDPQGLPFDFSEGMAKADARNTDLIFVPYYFRANRGGKGHMRVGLKHYG